MRYVLQGQTILQFPRIALHCNDHKDGFLLALGALGILIVLSMYQKSCVQC